MAETLCPHSRRRFTGRIWRKLANVALAALVAASVAGCAITPAQFQSTRLTLSDVGVCRAYLKVHEGNDLQFRADTSAELRRRGVQSSNCSAKVAEADAKRNDAILIGLGIAALAALAASPPRHGTGYSPYTSNYDYQWDWDQFYNQYGQLVWACRGVQTGRFAELYRCRGKPKTDWRWPSKRAF